VPSSSGSSSLTSVSASVSTIHQKYEIRSAG